MRQILGPGTGDPFLADAMRMPASVLAWDRERRRPRTWVQEEVIGVIRTSGVARTALREEHAIGLLLHGEIQPPARH